MVRLKTRVHNSIFSDFVAKNFDFNPAVTYWTNFNYSGYRHNWRIEEGPLTFDYLDDNGNSSRSYIGQVHSYWIGFHHNSEKPTDKHNLVIEFNPNKCLLHGLLDLILSTFFNTLSVEVVSIDVAMDIPININRLIIDKYRKHTYKLFDNGGDDKTHYLGKGDGRIKIYNKAREMGIEGDLTRYEISKEIRLPIGSVVSEGYVFNGELIPLGYINGEGINTDDKTLYSQYWAVLNGYPINELTRRYREKVRKLINNHASIEFDIKKISHTIRTWFQGYTKIYIKE